VNNFNLSLFDDFRKYSTFLELNYQSILLGRYNTPLTPPSLPCPKRVPNSENSAGSQKRPE
jgi:hypothetical protein